MTAIAQTRHDIRTQETTWEVQAWKPVLAGIAILLLPIVFLMLIVGGIIFWMPHVALPGIANGQTNHTDLQIAQSGIDTMKKMVGNNTAWSTAIKQEYDRLYAPSVVIK